MKSPAPRRRRPQQTKRLRGAARIGLDIVVDSRLWQVERGVRAWLRRALREAAAARHSGATSFHASPAD